MITKYTGKKALVMGASITKAGQWQKQLTEHLGFEVVTQARGGADFVSIVDGDPEGFVHTDPPLHRLGPDDVRDLELIVYFSSYNCRKMPYGESGDLYPEQKTVRGCIQYVINRIYEELAAADNLTCKLLFVTQVLINLESAGIFRVNHTGNTEAVKLCINFKVGLFS